MCCPAYFRRWSPLTSIFIRDGQVDIDSLPESPPISRERFSSCPTYKLSTNPKFLWGLEVLLRNVWKFHFISLYSHRKKIPITHIMHILYSNHILIPTSNYGYYASSFGWIFTCSHDIPKFSFQLCNYGSLTLRRLRPGHLRHAQRPEVGLGHSHRDGGDVGHLDAAGNARGWPWRRREIPEKPAHFKGNIIYLGDGLKNHVWLRLFGNCWKCYMFFLASLRNRSRTISISHVFCFGDDVLDLHSSVWKRQRWEKSQFSTQAGGEYDAFLSNHQSDHGVVKFHCFQEQQQNEVEVRTSTASHL